MEVVAERVADVPLVGTTLAVVVSSQQNAAVRFTQCKLLGGRVEYVAVLVGNGEFHDGGPTYFYIPYNS